MEPERPPSQFSHPFRTYGHRTVAGIAFILLSSTVDAQAPVMSDRTTCAEAVRFADSGNRDTARVAYLYLGDVMDGLDRSHTQQGEPGIMASLSDNGRIGLMAMAMLKCRSYPKMTAFNAAAASYNAMRDLGVQAGTAK